MGKMILTILLALFLVNCLAVLGVLGYGAATGRFGEEKRAQYLATWQGEKLIPEPEDSGAVEDTEAPQEAGMRIAALEEQREMASREIQRDIQLLRSQQNTLVMEQAKLQKDIDELQVKEVAFEEKMAEYNQKVQEEGFQKALKSYSQMKPKMVKEDFMQMTDVEMVRYISEMKSDVSKKILEQFRTPDEQLKRQGVMKLLETVQVVKLDEKEKGIIK
ncbi:MAG: hypothetical protein GY869_12340 [Planctomycetes bacterium]|nr:hypothetical protein [Planctomycetota bacterium]